MSGDNPTKEQGERLKNLEAKIPVWKNFHGIEGVEGIVMGHDIGITPHEFGVLESWWKFQKVPEFENKVPERIFKKVIHEFLLGVLKFIDKKRIETYKLNDELRAKGQSYQERKSQVADRMEFYKRKEVETRELIKKLPTIKLIPPRHWLRPEDIDIIKEKGLRRFIEFYYEIMIPHETNTTEPKIELAG